MSCGCRTALGFDHDASSRPSCSATRSSARDSFLRKASALPPSSEAIDAQSRPSFFSSQNPPLLGGQAALNFLQQIAHRHLIARALARRHKLSLIVVAGRDAAGVTALGMLSPRLGDQLVAGHGGEQLQELLGSLQLVLAGGRADEEAAQHRLADVHRVEQGSQASVGQPEPNCPPDRWLVALHQHRRQRPDRRLAPGGLTRRWRGRHPCADSRVSGKPDSFTLSAARSSRQRNPVARLINAVNEPRLTVLGPIARRQFSILCPVERRDCDSYTGDSVPRSARTSPARPETRIVMSRVTTLVLGSGPG